MSGFEQLLSRSDSWRVNERCCSSSTVFRWTSCVCRTRVWRLPCEWSDRLLQRRSKWLEGWYPEISECFLFF